MSQAPLGTVKSSIQSVNKTASGTATTAGGLKSNNGIENAVSGVADKEKTVSEAILETMFAFGIEHAQEFAQRGLDDDLRWWARMSQKTMVENFSAAQKQSAAAGMAGGIGAAGAAAGGLLAGLTNGGGGQGGNKDINDDDKIDNDRPNRNQRFNRNENRLEQQDQRFGEAQTEQISQNDNRSWQNQDFGVMEATDPDRLFNT